jgi:hypothetical protein
MLGRRGDLIYIYIYLDSDAVYKRWSYLYCFRQWCWVEEVILLIFIYAVMLGRRGDLIYIYLGSDAR